jgi:tetratricopeptide (TPR) repeat protein
LTIWYHASLGEARRALAEERFALARQPLARLAAWWPGRGEIELPLGVCEQAAGRIDAAVAAWSRIPTASPLFDEAALKRGEAEMDRGRLAAAEAVFKDALSHPGPRAPEVRHDLMQLFWQEGRLDEARALIERNWDAYGRALGALSAPAITNLRAHLSLDLEVYAVGRVDSLLTAAAAAAPTDERVWLARANLAMRSGKLAEARRWLESCLASRPDDRVVCATALELAMAADDGELAVRAASRLTTADLTPGKVAHTRAWFAARRGDRHLEQMILEDHLTHEPGDAVAIERLAELAISARQFARAAEHRCRKAELDRGRRLYATKVGNDFKADARELAKLADTLGRWFEAAAFLTMVVKLDPGEDKARERLAQLQRTRLCPSLEPAPQPLADVAGGLLSFSAAAAAPRTDSTWSVAFQDDAEAVGLRFAFENGRSPSRQLPETMSGGVGLLDYDGDGWLDVYAVQGGPFPQPGDGEFRQGDERGRSSHAEFGDRLFRNKRDGTFEDVTVRAGLAAFAGGYGHGVAVGDVDNDGDPDLFITRFGKYALYLNRGDATFEDATARWGLGGYRDWPTSAAFADLDGDGDLDLYVCHYVAWDPRHPRLCGNASGGPISYCVPHLLDPVPDHVFRNDGSRFHEVTASAGFTDPDGRGLGVLAGDLDGDGRVDVFVANDGTANFLFRNLGGFRFEETGLSAGVAANAEGGYQAGMGIACGDLDRDGRFDLVVTNFYGESTTFFRNLGDGLFGDHTTEIGLREPTRYMLGFGTAFLDVDNDGYLDLATTNGHVNDVRPIFPYAMPAQLLVGRGDGRLIDVSDRAGTVWQVPRIGRGLAAGDIDNDGRVDLVMLAQDGPLALFHNRSATNRSAGHFVTILLEGSTSNRDAVGAKVIVQAGGRRQVAQRLGGGSYQSASEPRLHFGLGDAATIELLEVQWPSGRVDHRRDLGADTGYHLREGDSRARPLKGFVGPRTGR